MYTISETEGTTPGMAYDTEAHEVKVKVTADSTGKLTAKVDYEQGLLADLLNGDVLKITNTYTRPTGVTQLTVKKDVKGSPFTGSEQFA